MADKKKIFVVDDSEATRQIIKEYLEHRGEFEVTTFKDGLEVISEIEDRYKVPYLILTDMKMPRMNGAQLTEKIKTFFSPKIPVVIMTATPYLVPSNHKANAIVAKPPNFNALYNLICELTKQ